MCTCAFTASTAAVAGQPAKTVKLFDGKDLSAWTHVLSDEKAKFGDVWSVADGVLICKGKPAGYLRTKEDFRDYVLTLEWRFPEGSDGGNSGVLVHTSTPNEIGIWPKSLEVQLHKGNAGDFWVIGHTIEVPDAENRQKGRRFLNLTDDSEKLQRGFHRGKSQRHAREPGRKDQRRRRRDLPAVRGGRDSLPQYRADAGQVRNARRDFVFRTQRHNEAASKEAARNLGRRFNSCRSTWTATR
jgi:hypothetical protein